MNHYFESKFKVFFFQRMKISYVNPTFAGWFPGAHIFLVTITTSNLFDLYNKHGYIQGLNTVLVARVSFMQLLRYFHQGFLGKHLQSCPKRHHFIQLRWIIKTVRTITFDKLLTSTTHDLCEVNIMTDKFNVKFAKTSIKLLLEKELSKKKNLKPNAVRSWMLMLDRYITNLSTVAKWPLFVNFN